MTNEIDQHEALATVRTAIADRLREVDERFGVQRLRNGTGDWSGISSRYTNFSALADHYRRVNDAIQPEQRAWIHILLEEVFEAGSEHHDRLYDELVDVGAVVEGWLRDLELKRMSAAELAHRDYSERVF